MQNKVFLTGANGFVGRRLAFALMKKKEISLTLTARQKIENNGDFLSILADLEKIKNLSSILSSHTTLIHTAGRSSNGKVKNRAVLSNAFRSANVETTIKLANQAAEVGVRRFIFISSIKVHGETTFPGMPFSVDSQFDPQDLYAESKYQAEYSLKEIANKTGMELVIIRPPLIYGPSVGGNFLSLAKLIQNGIPLPFASIKNKRSFLALDNLVDLIIKCIDHPLAANQTFLASDGQDLSTPEFLKSLAKAIDKPLRLFAFPVPILEYGAKLVKKEAVARRLFGSLQIDTSKTENILGWVPPLSVEKGLKLTFIN